MSTIGWYYINVDRNQLEILDFEEVLMLVKEQFELVKRWMYKKARPLDIARLKFHFEGGSVEDVVMALQAYQNEDGGFGNGLEADCLNPNSSPLQTWWATQFLKEVGMTDKKHPVIKGILRYLESGDGTAQNRWQFSVKSNNDYPRAPWWTYSEADENPGYNPTAALVGFIMKNADKERSLYQKGISLAKESLDTYMAREELTEMHELACFIELHTYLIQLGIEDLCDLEAFKAKLKEEVFKTIEQDSKQWASTYCCKPSHLFSTADSMFYEDNKGIMDEELDFIVSALSKEGTWAVTWEWGDYTAEFAISKMWWQANIAIKNTLMIRDFGLLED